MKLVRDFGRELQTRAGQKGVEALSLPVWQANYLVLLIDEEGAYVIFCSHAASPPTYLMADVPGEGYVGLRSALSKLPEVRVNPAVASPAFAQPVYSFEVSLADLDSTEHESKLDRVAREQAEDYLEAYPTKRSTSEPPPMPDFIDSDRLRALRIAKSNDFDLQRLIKLCEELNVNWHHRCYHAVTMLTRAILDHVPPLFGFRNFREVASNYGGKSFKEQMDFLEKSARKIGDAHLHGPIRRREPLPTAAQVHPIQTALDVLLAEILQKLE